MSPAEKEAREMMADKKASEAAERAYERSLTTMEPVSAPKPAASMPVKKMAKGGSVSSASKRADGCAVKGKTKGTIVRMG